MFIYLVYKFGYCIASKMVWFQMIPRPHRYWFLLGNLNCLYESSNFQCRLSGNHLEFSFITMPTFLKDGPICIFQRNKT